MLVGNVICICPSSRVPPLCPLPFALSLSLSLVLFYVLPLLQPLCKNFVSFRGTRNSSQTRVSFGGSLAGVSPVPPSEECRAVPWHYRFRIQTGTGAVIRDTNSVEQREATPGWSERERDATRQTADDLAFLRFRLLPVITFPRSLR